MESVLWLPSRAGAPVRGDAADEGGAPELRPFRVDGSLLDWCGALALLDLGGRRRVLANGSHVAPDLAWFAAVARVAVACVGRQSLVPDLVADDDRWRARWRPIWSEAEHAALGRLAQAMPGAARALGTADAPPTLDTEATTRAVASDLADALVRATLPARPGRRGGGPPEREWLLALGRRDGLVALAPAAATGLLERVRAWQRPLLTTLEAPVRVSLRLEEPAGDDAHWRLEYLVYPVGDPSLLVPARSLWQRGGLPPEVTRQLGRGREVLLATLGRLAPLSVPIARSLSTGRPEAATLDVGEAYEFLAATAALLSQSGVSVLLPAWWGGSGSRLRLTAEARAHPSTERAGKAGLSADSLVDVDLGVALGDERLSEEELAALAAMKAPLVRLRGQWVEADPARVAALLAARRKGGRDVRTVGDVARLAVGLGPLAAGTDVEVDVLAGDETMGALLASLADPATLSPPAPPAMFQGELRPYQARGYAWLDFLTGLGLGALLGDDMGLGKTVQTLCLLARLYELEPERRFLLVCPTSLLGNWRREAARFTPALPVSVHHGGERERALVSTAFPAGLVLTSYGVLARDRDLLAQVEWAAVILDEAQRVKNHATNAARAARSLPAARRVALTGTPVENHVGDLWSIMEFLQPGALGSRAAFRERYLLPIQADPHGPAAESLRRRTGPFLLRRLKTDKRIIADLPDKLELKVACTITAEQASLYQAVLDDMAQALRAGQEGIARQGVVLSTLLRLKQVLDHPALFLGDGSRLAGRSGKLERLEAMLGEVVESGERALVFSQFAAMATLLRHHLEAVLGREVLLLSGDTAPRERERIVARFQTEGEAPPVFVLTLGAGGTGLNLTAASHVFHYDRWWNPAVENQATDRAFRIGQRRTVEVHKFVCAGTLEERIDALLEQKRAVAEEVVGTGEGWLARLDTDVLLDVLRLDAREAVEA